MKLFELQEPVKQPAPLLPRVDRTVFMKQKQLDYFTRIGAVRSAFEEWLFAMPGILPTQRLLEQIARLPFDDETAIAWLSYSKGKMGIYKPTTKKPELDCPLIEKLKTDPFIAVYGKGARDELERTYSTLKTAGIIVYGLDVDELATEYKSWNERGRLALLERNAKLAEVLFVDGYSRCHRMPTHCRNFMEQMKQYRVQNQLPIISDWARMWEVSNEWFFDSPFKIYHIK